MSKLLIHPPATTTSFTFTAGCGKPHEYDGEGIDCEPCVAHLATLPPDERVAMRLRGPAPVSGSTPEERAAYAQAYLADRERFSWRLIPKGEDPNTETDNPLVDENAALKARIAELEEAAKDKPPATAKKAAAKS